MDQYSEDFNDDEDGKKKKIFSITYISGYANFIMMDLFNFF